MPTIKEDILTFSSMIAKGFTSEKLNLDYTLSSFKDIDTFYHRHSKNGERVEGDKFSKNLGQILFAIGGYIGETIIKIVPGTVWETDENDPEGEINAILKLPDGTIVWPMQRAIKRFKNGEEDGIYVYGYHILQGYADVEKLLNQEKAKRKKKSWWKL
jgi:hypothetical protein